MDLKHLRQAKTDDKAQVVPAADCAELSQSVVYV